MNLPQKYTIIKAGFVIAITLAALPKETGQLIPMKTLDLRMFPGIQRDSDEWNRIYKIRTIVERSINHFKTNMCIAGRKTKKPYPPQKLIFSSLALPAS